MLLAIDQFNRIYVVDNGEVRQRDHAGVCETLQLSGEFSYRKGLAFTQANELVVSNDTDNKIRIFENTPVFRFNPGLNDAWYNPATPGQGFFVTVFPFIGEVFLAWFTFDTERPPNGSPAELGEAGHRWLTAFGTFADNQAILDIEISQGGIFDSAEAVVTQDLDGTVILEFTGCNQGTVSYAIPSINRQGIVPIERISLDNVPLCESFEPQVQQSR